FGSPLVDRLGKEIAPTRAGALLYRYAKRLLALRDETETAINQFMGMVRGKLAVGGSTIPGGFFLPCLIGGFIRKYPEVRISLTVGDTQSIIRGILDGELEIGVVGAMVDNKKIVQEKVIDDEMRLIVSSGHKWAKRRRISIKELAEEPFIIREKGSGTLTSFQSSLNDINSDTEALNIVAEMGSTTAVIQGIKQNIGVSVLSTIAVAEEIAAGSLKQLTIDGLNLKRSFYFTRNRLRSLSPLADVFSTFSSSSGILSSSSVLRSRFFGL
ncbi:MAG: LysR substrate-binding domain-containing protein, partial [Desulfosudaceae bacterium]